MKAVVTGSSGFLGSALSKKLLNEGHRVTGVDVKAASIRHELYNHYTCNLLEKKVEDVFRETKPDICFHLAAIADLNYARQHIYETIEVNVGGTWRVAELCRKHDVMLSFISSCCVYGNTDRHPTDENAAKHPTEIYGFTKLVAERGIMELGDLRWNILRPSTVYGPGMRETLAVYIFIDRALRGEKLPIHGTGKQTRTFIYVDDLVEGIVKASRFEGEVFNLAGAETLSVLEVASRVLNALGYPQEKHKELMEHVPDRPGQVMHEEISIEKAKRVMGWTPKIRFEEGLRRTIQWLRRS